jgi:hypothetical protein
MSYRSFKYERLLTMLSAVSRCKPQHFIEIGEVVQPYRPTAANLLFIQHGDSNNPAI